MPEEAPTTADFTSEIVYCQNTTHTAKVSIETHHPLHKKNGCRPWGEPDFCWNSLKGSGGQRFSNVVDFTAHQVSFMYG